MTWLSVVIPAYNEQRVIGDSLTRIGAYLEHTPDPERVRLVSVHGGDDLVRLVDWRQGNPNDTVGEVRLQLRGDFERQTSLANPTRTGQRDERNVWRRDERGNRRDLLLAAQKWCH